jgi:hypothetical protein
MLENKSNVLFKILIIALIAGGALLYVSIYENYTNRIGIFPDKIGDMNITSYKGGFAGIAEIKWPHGGLPRKIKNSYAVEYGSNSTNKAKFWVAEPANHDDAVYLVKVMSSAVEESGYSNRTSMTVDGIDVYFVSEPSGHGLYNYFYVKDNRIFWIQLDNSDESYRLNFLKESIKSI